MGASVPPLGLSNKATTDGQYLIVRGWTTLLKMPLLADEAQSPGASTTLRYPFESELASVTLWPEIEKIFGHGYEARFIIPILSFFDLISS